MYLLRIAAYFIVLWQRGWRRIRMLILRYAFHQHGRGFIFDPDGYFTYETIDVGDYVSINRNPIFLATRSHIIIGNRVMFGYNVIIIGGNHNTSVVGKFMVDVQEKRPQDDQDVTIEDDVWVGSGAIILKSVRIGRGSIIGAGAVVNKSVLPYSIIAGVPGKRISIRFGNINTIMNHEAALYPPEDRLSKERLEAIFNSD
jgi:acetyltransferase-like isoleucine patch superfamily enzyme